LIVRALMPPIHDWLTGGSLYNNRVLAHLEKSATVELHLDSRVEDKTKWRGGLWLVDSLCLHTSVLRSDAKGVLIAHYLKLLDPLHQHSSAAEAELAALQSFTAVITTSAFSRRVLLEAGYRGRVEAILPGLKSTYRRPVTIRSSGSPTILTVATLLPDKGLLEMLAALERLGDLEWSWEIIGDSKLDPAFAEELSIRLNQSPLRDRVLLRGAIAPELVEAAYDRANIFALASRFESCSMATMEAMARGLPVVAFRVGGLPDLLPEISRRTLAESGDRDAFAGTLRMLIKDAGERSDLGRANLEASRRFPSWEDTGAAVESLLRELSIPGGLAP
jgi:glycosyltransferase involved in cell wall biosynthesis